MRAAKELRFRTLWQDERSNIAAYALRRTDSAEDAADVVADTFAIAWQRIDEVPSGHDGRLWLYATARNVLLNLHRTSRRRWRLAERLVHEFTVASVVDYPIGEDILSAKQLLESLDEPTREILMLTGWEGLDSTELGRVLDCSPVAARIRLYRARARLIEQRRIPMPKPKQSPAIGHVSGSGVATTPQTNPQD
jgi:RNA polymerase sigma factor (sigma-70 family)